MTPAEELRAAATRLRETADRIPQGTDDNHKDWAGVPWRAEECARGCPCIVYQGNYPDDPSMPIMPPIQYVADAESDEHAAWIALVHTGLAAPLATWLDVVAEDMRQRGAVEGSASKQVHPTDFVGLGTPREEWTSALAAARVINGGAS